MAGVTCAFAPWAEGSSARQGAPRTAATTAPSRFASTWTFAAGQCNRRGHRIAAHGTRVAPPACAEFIASGARAPAEDVATQPAATLACTHALAGIRAPRKRRLSPVERPPATATIGSIAQTCAFPCKSAWTQTRPTQSREMRHNAPSLCPARYATARPIKRSIATAACPPRRGSTNQAIAQAAGQAAQGPCHWSQRDSAGRSFLVYPRSVLFGISDMILSLAKC